MTDRIIPEMPEVEALADNILSCGTKRSQAYRAGLIDALNYRLHGESIPHSYADGTAEADAFYSGIDRGHFEWRNGLCNRMLRAKLAAKAVVRSYTVLVEAAHAKKRCPDGIDELGRAVFRLERVTGGRP